MDYVPIVLSISLVVLTIVLTVVGIQLMLVLSQLKRTFEKLNNTLDIAESRISSIVSPLQNLGGLASGLKTGMKVFETFVSWISRDKEKDSGEK